MQVPLPALHDITESFIFFALLEETNCIFNLFMYVCPCNCHFLFMRLGTLISKGTYLLVERLTGGLNVLRWIHTCNVTACRNAVTLQMPGTIRSYELNFHLKPHDVRVSCERYTLVAPSLLWGPERRLCS